MSAVALSWDRRRRSRHTQHATDEQLTTVAGQLLAAGQIIGRLEVVASQFEKIAARILQDEDGEAGRDG